MVVRARSFFETSAAPFLVVFGSIAALCAVEVILHFFSL